MSCNQFCQCVCSLKREEKPVKKQKRKEKNRKNKKDDGSKTEYIFTGSACKNKEQISKCVCFLDKRSRASCTEKGKTYTLVNHNPPTEVLCMHIDEGVVGNNDGTRCDYAFFVRDGIDQGQGRMILIELKGGNVQKALTQLKKTLDLAEVQELKKKYKRVYGRVVFSSCPPRIRNSDLHLDMKEEFDTLHGNLKMTEVDFVEEYNELDNG